MQTMDTHHPLSHQLGTLLNNSEGVQLFHKFLSSTFSSGHFLDFWFACKGFRSIVDGDDQLKLLQVAKAIYRNYIKTGATSAVPVNESTKREIRSTLAAFSHSYHKSSTGEKRLPTLRSLFDAAQADVQNLLARSYFFEFLQSDSYRMLHQSSVLLDCNSFVPLKSPHYGFHEKSDKRGNYAPKSNSYQSRTQSSSGDGPPCDVLPTDQHPPSLPPPVLPQCDLSNSKHMSNSANAANPTSANMTGCGSSDKSRRTTIESGTRELVTATELIAFMKPATTTGTDNSAPVVSDSTNSQQLQVQPPATTTTTRKPGTNLAEVDPSAFALTLSHRLEKVKESRGKMERLLSKMQPTDPDDNCGEDPEMASIHAELSVSNALPCPAAFQQPQPAARSARLPPSTRRSTSAASSDLLRKKLSALLPPPLSNAPYQQTPINAASAAGKEDDDAQVILEDHCSRIWTDERQRQPLNVCRKSGRRSDVYSISSFDSGVVGGFGGVGLNSSDSESCVSRGGAYRWNYGAPPSLPPPPLPPPICSYCRQAPSMSSTPAPNRRACEYTRWAGVQYQRVQYQHHGGSNHHSHHSHNYEESSGGYGGNRTMRSRSLTSDSPSVFDSGLSSTYDHLPAPPPRRSRHDEHKFAHDVATPPVSGRPTPRPGDELTLRLFGECGIAAPVGGGGTLAATNNFDLINNSNDCGLHPGPDRQKYNQLPRNQPPFPLPATPGCTESAKQMAFTSNQPSLPAQQPNGPAISLVVGYYLCDDPVPYRTVWTGPSVSNGSNAPSITLGQFKQLVVKKGVYRYFFKTASDDFGTGCVHEEVGDDSVVLPLWEGKVIARVERTD